MVMIICSQSYRDWVAPGTQKEIKYIICLKKKNLPNLPQKKTTTTPTIFRQSNLNVPCASNTTMPKGSFLLGTITASQDLKSAWSKGPHTGSCLTWPCGSKFGNVRFLQKMSIFTISYGEIFHSWNTDFFFQLPSALPGANHLQVCRTALNLRITATKTSWTNQPAVFAVEIFRFSHPKHWVSQAEPAKCTAWLTPNLGSPKEKLDALKYWLKFWIQT